MKVNVNTDVKACGYIDCPDAAKKISDDTAKVRRAVWVEGKI